MSKKLLMNNYSENGLMPVMDGLICWLDARDDENGNNVWIDRSGNDNNGILYNFDSSSFEHGYLVSKNNRNYVEIFNNISIENKTFIINTQIDKNNSTNLLMGGWQYNIHEKFCFGIMNKYPNSSLCSVLTTFKGQAPTVLSKFKYISDYTNISITVKNNQVKTFINGELNATSNLPERVKAILDNFYLLRKDDELNACCRATIGSFMAYDRDLTEEEILQNYLYEQSIERG